MRFPRSSLTLVGLLAAIALPVMAFSRAPKFAGCRANDAWNARFQSFITFTLRETSYKAQRQRDYTELPNNTQAVVAEVTDPQVCAALAMTFAATVPGRDTTHLLDVVVLSVDSTYYIVSDWKGGPGPQFTKNANGSTTYSNAPQWFDALTVTRATNATKVFRWYWSE